MVAKRKGQGTVTRGQARDGSAPIGTRPSRPKPRHCIVCGTKLRPIREHGVARMAWPRCGFIACRNPVPACGVIVMRNGEVLLAKRAHEPPGGSRLIAAGLMQYGERPERPAERQAER